MTTPTSSEIEARLLNSLKRGPGITLWLDIINKCNLRCIMCHFSDDKLSREPVKSFSPEEFKGIFDGIAPYVSEVALSCGAEPLVSKHFAEILSIVSDYPASLGIKFCTNAMLMNALIRNLIIEKGVTRILLSMDGVTKATLERIRAGSKYEKVVGNIMALRDIKLDSGSQFPVMQLIFVMMNSNIHEAPAFIELAKRLGVEIVEFHHVVPSGYTIDIQDERLSNHKAKYNYYREQIINAARFQGIDVIMPAPFDVEKQWQPDESIPHVDLSDFNKVEPSRATEILPIPKLFPNDFTTRNSCSTIVEDFSKTYCLIPFTQIIVRNLNEVVPCGFFNTSLGLLSNGKSLSDIFFGEDFQRVRHNMYLPEGDPNCCGCPVKGGLLPKQIEKIEKESNRFSLKTRLKKLARKLI